MCCNILGATWFLERLLFHNYSEWLLRHSSYIFGVDIFSEQLLFSPFSEQPLFQRSYFFRIASFSERKFYRAAISWEWVMAVTFSNSCFFLFRVNISKKELLFQGRYFYTISTFSEKLHFGKSKFFRKGIFRITYFFWRAAFLERLLFRKTEELVFHSYASFPQLHYSLIIKWAVLPCASIIAQSCIIDG